MDARKKRSRSGPIAALVVAVPILYVLSSGPALTLANYGLITFETWARVYQPVTWLYHAVPPLQAPLNRWTDLWDPPAPEGN